MSSTTTIETYWTYIWPQQTHASAGQKSIKPIYQNMKLLLKHKGLNSNMILQNLLQFSITLDLDVWLHWIALLYARKAY